MYDGDSYSQLRSSAATPSDEICRCPGQNPIKLMTALGLNPLHCVNCNLEVPPESFALTPVLVSEIVKWRAIDDALHHLWLDSGEYESWAKAQLSDIKSPANTQGLHLREKLNVLRRCYFAYFQDQSGENFQSIQTCPNCHLTLTVYPNGKFFQLVCEDCSIITFGE